MAELRRPQYFPIYYTGEAPFLDNNNQRSGLTGARALVTIDLSTRPAFFLGVRIVNSYEVPDEDDLDLFPDAFSTWEQIKLLDQEQDVRFDLAQQNIIVKQAAQATIQGQNRLGSPWHSFACPYPFRGGNKIDVELTRTASYPQVGDPLRQVILPVAKVTMIGLLAVDDAGTGQHEPGSPPSTVGLDGY